MPKNRPVSDRPSLTELDTASEYSTALSELDRGDCALDVVDERPSVVNGFYSNVTQEDIVIHVDACVVVICDLATPRRNWVEFKRTPPGAKRLASEYGVLTFKAAAEHAQPLIRPVTPRTPSLTLQLAAALKAHDTETALDAIFDAVDSALLAGRFRECDRALASVNVAEWPTDLLIGLLSITLAASHKLPARAAFFERAQRALSQRGEDTLGLLDGLE